MKYKFRLTYSSKDLKIQAVTTLKKELSEAKSLILFSSTFITHQDFELLRKKLLVVNAKLRFVKNTLFRVAAKDLGLPNSLYTDQILHEPTAVIFVNSDEFIAPIKVLKEDFGKNEHFKIKVAFLEKELYENTKVMAFAHIPSKEVLLGKLVGSLKSPIYGLYHSLTYDLRRLVVGLSAISSKVQG